MKYWNQYINVLGLAYMTRAELVKAIAGSIALVLGVLAVVFVVGAVA